MPQSPQRPTGRSSRSLGTHERFKLCLSLTTITSKYSFEAREELCKCFAWSAGSWQKYCAQNSDGWPWRVLWLPESSLHSGYTRGPWELQLAVSESPLDEFVVWQALSCTLFEFDWLLRNGQSLHGLVCAPLPDGLLVLLVLFAVSNLYATLASPRASWQTGETHRIWNYCI